MGIIKSSLFIEARGTFGNAIIYGAGGQTRIRLKTGQYKDRKSPEQLAQRSKLKNASALYHKLDMPLFVTWTHMTKGTTLNGYNLFVKTNIRNFTAGGEIVDYNALQLCCGRLALPEHFNVTRTDGGGVQIEWDVQYSAVSAGTDWLQVVAYTPGKKKGPVVRQMEDVYVRRDARKCEFRLPQSVAGPVYLYVYFRGKYTNECSGSFYLGRWDTEV